MKSLLAVCAIFALAASPLSATSAGKEGGPCKPVVEACKATGKQGREIWKCVRAIKTGKQVKDVNVTASDECKAAKGRGPGRGKPGQGAGGAPAAGGDSGGE